MSDSFGSGRAGSVNKRNGGKYTDRVYNTLSRERETALNDYLNDVSSPNMNGKQSYRAYGQLFGEYAAYAGRMMQHAGEKFGLTIDGRLSDLQSATALSFGQSEGVASQYAYASGMEPARRGGTIWAGGFGNWAKQKEKNYIHGYDYDGAGLQLGYEHRLDCIVLGFAGSYTDARLKVKDLDTRFDGDILNLAAYGAYMHESGFYASGRLGFGYGWNDYKVDMVMGGKKKGDYDNQTYSAAGEIGYSFQLPARFTLTPSVGIDYTHFRQEKWKERGGRVNDFFRKRSDHWVQVPLAVKASTVFQLGSDWTLIPEAKVAYLYQAKKSRARIKMGYVGASSTTTMVGVDTGRSRWLLGAGATARYGDRFDFGIDYSFETRSKFHSHGLTGTVGISF